MRAVQFGDHQRRRLPADPSVALDLRNLDHAERSMELHDAVAPDLLEDPDVPGVRNATHGTVPVDFLADPDVPAVSDDRDATMLVDFLTDEDSQAGLETRLAVLGDLLSDRDRSVALQVALRVLLDLLPDGDRSRRRQTAVAVLVDLFGDDDRSANRRDIHAAVLVDLLDIDIAVKRRGATIVRTTVEGAQVCRLSDDRRPIAVVRLATADPHPSADRRNSGIGHGKQHVIARRQEGGVRGDTGLQLHETLFQPTVELQPNGALIHVHGMRDRARTHEDQPSDWRIRMQTDRNNRAVFGLPGPVLDRRPLPTAEIGWIVDLNTRVVSARLTLDVRVVVRTRVTGDGNSRVGKEDRGGVIGARSLRVRGGHRTEFLGLGVEDLCEEHVVLGVSRSRPSTNAVHDEYFAVRQQNQITQ